MVKGYTQCIREVRCILRFIFSRFKYFSFFSVTSFVLAGMIYTMPQIKPLNWFRGSQLPFYKNTTFPIGIGGGGGVNYSLD